MKKKKEHDAKKQSRIAFFGCFGLIAIVILFLGIGIASSSRKPAKDRTVSDKEIITLMQTYSEFAIQDSKKLKRADVDRDSIEYYPIGKDKKTWSVGGNVTEQNNNKIYRFGLKIKFDKDILDKDTDIRKLKYGSEVEFLR